MDKVTVNGDKVTINGIVLFSNSPAIIAALNRVNETMLPLPVSYRIQKLIKALQVEFKAIDQIKIDLFKLYGKEVSPGTYSLEDDKEAQEKFTKDFDEMVGDRNPEFQVIAMSLNDPTTYGQSAIFTPKDLSILIELNLLRITE